MIHTFEIRFKRSIKIAKGLFGARIDSYVTIEAKGTHAAEAKNKARAWFPGWTLVDWSVKK